ncbi:hypothetical protein SESBI_30899 [Sesbania bispinosa]|nr:hypothetical protein SESBI_30899 [Sesbania bispinosa]
MTHSTSAARSALPHPFPPGTGDLDDPFHFSRKVRSAFVPSRLLLPPLFFHFH